MAEENKKKEVVDHKLSEAVAAKYEFAGGAHATRMTLPKKFGGMPVDFRTITLAEADKLAAIDGFPYLKLKQAGAPKASSQTAEKK